MVCSPLSSKLFGIDGLNNKKPPARVTNKLATLSCIIVSKLDKQAP